MMRRSTIWFLHILLFSPLCLPIITKLQVWRMPTKDGYRYCHFLMDQHVDYRDGSLGTRQRNELLEIARMSRTPYFIIEDPASYHGSYEPFMTVASKLKNDYENFYSKTLIDYLPSVICGGLGKSCKQYGIGWCNAECRYFHYYDLYVPVFDWQSLTEKLKQYVATLNASKHPVLKRYEDILLKGLAETPKNDIVKLNELCFYLLEARTLHALIKKQPQQKNIFVCVGGEHAQNIENDMRLLGYEQVFSYGHMPEEIEQVPSKALDLKTLFIQKIAHLDATILK